MLPLTSEQAQRRRSQSRLETSSEAWVRGGAEEGGLGLSGVGPRVGLGTAFPSLAETACCTLVSGMTRGACSRWGPLTRPTTQAHCTGYP